MSDSVTKVPIKITLIVATSLNDVIGLNNKIIWKLKDDMKFFRSYTMNKHLIMGRKTADSLGVPLPNRFNMVLTRSSEHFERLMQLGFTCASDLQLAIQMLEYPVTCAYWNHKQPAEIVIIGGAQIYDEAMKLGIIDEILYTVVTAEVEGDAFFDPLAYGFDWKKELVEFHSKNDRNEYSFAIYKLTRNK